MFWIELHSDDVDNAQQGSFCYRPKEQQPNVEAYLRAMTKQEWSRAYIMEYGRVQAVYYRSLTDSFHCIGYGHSYRNDWLPSVVYDGMGIITGVWGPSGTSLEEAYQWAQRTFMSDTSTVVVLRDGRVYAAFERVQGAVRLVACCPAIER